MDESLRLGRETYARRAWHDAYHALLRADEAASLEAGDLEQLAIAAYLVGREAEFQRLIERLHRMHLQAGDHERAVRCTFWLALSFLLTGDTGQSHAWSARGHRLIGNRDCPERGYLLVVAATGHLLEGEAGAAHEAAAEATGIGERCGDGDLTAAARHMQGKALIRQGRLMSGLKLLDEAMLAVIADELSPIMTGLIYCSVIQACCEVYELRRAREWTFALSRWCEQQSEMVAFTGVCLVHRAEVMQFLGSWPEALAEAVRACARFPPSARRPTGAALYQQAEIYRLRGDVAKAEECYRYASRLGYEPQPGLALLRMAQERTEAACAAMRRLLVATTGQLARAKLLPACIEIMLAKGEIEPARAACEELQALAATFDTDVLRALSAQAQGTLALAQNDALAAIGPLRQAFELWERLDACYHCARARVLIGQASLALGDDEAAELELEAARCVFSQLGALPDVERVEALLAPACPGRLLTARELEVLRLIAAGHTNKGIAAELCRSERTIDRHVSSILSKLNVPSRAAATAYACGHELI